MSWCIKKIGKREAVRAEISADKNLPDPIKGAILSVLQDEPAAWTEITGVIVEAVGHNYMGPGSAMSNIVTLKVEPIPLVESV
jgi:hypothetical protein